MKRLILRAYLFACFILFSAFTYSVYALEINGYDPAHNDRFISGTYGTNNPVPNSNFIGASYDWSGVGWDSSLPGRSVTLISPEHFVCANHYRIPEGSSVVFLSSNGQLKSYTVERYSTFATSGASYTADLALGWLSQSIPDSDGIAHYSVINAEDPAVSGFDSAWYTGKEMLVYGAGARAGKNNIDLFRLVATKPQSADMTYAWGYSYDGMSGYADQAGLQGGDSGSPSFIAWNGKLMAVGTHFAVGNFASGSWDNFDSAIPWYIDQMNLAMAPSGYSVDVVNPVPEPATVFLFLAGLPYLLRRHSR